MGLDSFWGLSELDVVGASLDTGDWVPSPMSADDSCAVVASGMFFGSL